MSLVWRKILLASAVCLNLVLLYSLIWGSMGLIPYRDQKKLHAKLEDNIATLDKENHALEEEIGLLRDDVKYQEKLIRNRLNFVKRNEILYIFPQTGAVQAGAETDD